MNKTGIIQRLQLLGVIHAAVATTDDWCAIVAPPGSGKTTLAKQLAETLQKNRKRWRVHLVAFQEASTLEAAWRQVLLKWGLEEKELEEIISVPVADGLRGFFQKSSEDVCVILDDLDQLPTQVLRLLAAELRRFHDRRKEREEFKRFHIVLFGGMELHYLTVGSYSPLSNVLTPIQIPDLTAEEAHQSLAERTGKPDLGRQTEEALFAETAGHPSLVAAIAERLSAGAWTPTPETIKAAAQGWVEQCVRGIDASDPCLKETIGFMQTHRLSYATVLTLLNGDPKPVTTPEDEVIMSGAVVFHERRYAFRGKMLAEGLRRHLDPLRRADYWCLHGAWDKARELYRSVSVADIRSRRWLVHSKSDQEIHDLYLGVTPMAMEWSEAQAEQFIAELGRHFFGADQSILWRLEPEKEKAAVVAVYPPEIEAKDRNLVEGLASQAARHHLLTALENNRGVVQGIGATVGSTRWALSLNYVEGIPSGPGAAVDINLRRAEPSFFMVLERARQRDLNEGRLRAQRRLIHGINLRLQRSTKLKEVFEAIVNGIRDDLHYECAQLSLVFPEEGLIRAVATNGAFDLIKHITVRDLNGTDILAVVCRDRIPGNVTDCKSLDRFNCDKEAVDLSKLKSQVVLPLFDGERAIGVLQVGDTARMSAFRSIDLELLQPLADCAAIAIGRAREREAFDLGFRATNSAVAIIDAADKVVSCNEAYRTFLGTSPGGPTPLTSGSDSLPESLVRVAFRQGYTVSTVRDFQGKKCDVTAEVDPKNWTTC